MSHWTISETIHNFHSAASVSESEILPLKIFWSEGKTGKVNNTKLLSISYVGNMDSGIEGTLSKFCYNIKLYSAVNLQKAGCKSQPSSWYKPTCTTWSESEMRDNSI